MIGSMVGGIIAALAAQGIINLFVRQTEKDITVMSGDKQIAKIEVPKQQVAGLRTYEAYISRKSTTLTRKPDTPQVEFRYSQTSGIRLLSLTLIPDAAFKTKGLAQIVIGRRRVVTIEAADLTDVDAFNLPIPEGGLNIDPAETIQVFLWTLDGTASAATVSAAVGDY